MKAEVFLYIFNRLVCHSDPRSVTFEVLTTSRRNTCDFYLDFESMTALAFRLILKFHDPHSTSTSNSTSLYNHDSTIQHKKLDDPNIPHLDLRISF